MARRPAAEQGDTLTRIQDAAFTLFGRYGYDGVSMLAVANAAGVTKAALYWHYNGKQALYTDCMHRLNGLFRGHVFEHMKTRNDPMERLLAVFEGIGSLLADPWIREGIAGYWLQPATAEVPDALAAQAQFEEVSAQAIAATLRRAVAAGQLDLMIPVEDMANAFISTMEAIVLPLRRNRDERSRRLIGVLAHSFFRAHGRSTDLTQRAIDVACAPLAAA